MFVIWAIIQRRRDLNPRRVLNRSPLAGEYNKPLCHFSKVGRERIELSTLFAAVLQTVAYINRRADPWKTLSVDGPRTHYSHAWKACRSTTSRSTPSFKMSTKCLLNACLKSRFVFFYKAHSRTQRLGLEPRFFGFGDRRVSQLHHRCIW